jgi:hypothetical protein
VLHLLLVLVPLGMAAAVSPVMLTEQTVLLAGPRGRRTGSLYAAGTGLVLAAYVAGVFVLGRSLALPHAPHLDARLDLVVGALLLALAAVVWRWHPRGHQHDRHEHKQLSPPAALGFGIFAMATNFTTLALLFGAAKEIAADQVPVWEGVLAAALLVALGCLPAWGPVALDTALPEAADRLLGRLERVITEHGRTLVALLIGAAGLFFLGRGIIHLVGL